MRTDFHSACGGYGRAEGESKSVPIRLVRSIRFTILSLHAEGVIKIRVNPPNPRHPRCHHCHSTPKAFKREAPKTLYPSCTS
jgi:hypothetical protein